MISVAFNTSPNSSFVSLMAVSSKFRSSTGSYLPPGKQTSPLWNRTLLLRLVRINMGSGTMIMNYYQNRCTGQTVIFGFHVTGHHLSEYPLSSAIIRFEWAIS